MNFLTFYRIFLYLYIEISDLSLDSLAFRVVQRLLHHCRRVACTEELHLDAYARHGIFDGEIAICYALAQRIAVARAGHVAQYPFAIQQWFAAQPDGGWIIQHETA